MSPRAKKCRKASPNRYIQKCDNSVKIMICKPGEFRVMCCVNAFSLHSTCTLAYCPACWQGLESKGRDNDCRPMRRKGMGNSTIRATGVKNLGICGNHVHEDISKLVIQDDKKYLSNKRTNLTGVMHVAKTCWGCGVWF